MLTRRPKFGGLSRRERLNRPRRESGESRDLKRTEVSFFLAANLECTAEIKA
jgi:hypothetical protein